MEKPREQSSLLQVLKGSEYVYGTVTLSEGKRLSVDVQLTDAIPGYKDEDGLSDTPYCLDIGPEPHEGKVETWSSRRFLLSSDGKIVQEREKLAKYSEQDPFPGEVAQGVSPDQVLAVVSAAMNTWQERGRRERPSQDDAVDDAIKGWRRANYVGDIFGGM